MKRIRVLEIILGVSVVLTETSMAEWKTEGKNIGQACFTLRENSNSLLSPEILGTNTKTDSNLISDREERQIGFNLGKVNDKHKNKIGIYTTEFLITSIVSVSCSIIILEFDTPAPEFVFPMVEIPSNTLLAPLTVWGTGKFLKEEGSFWKAMIGGGIGAIVVGIVPILPFFILPPLGAVIGYNL